MRTLTPASVKAFEGNKEYIGAVLESNAKKALDQIKANNPVLKDLTMKIDEQ